MTLCRYTWLHMALAGGFTFFNILQVRPNSSLLASHDLHRKLDPLQPILASHVCEIEHSRTRRRSYSGIHVANTGKRSEYKITWVRVADVFA